MASQPDPGELLRARGLRVTPQRRAILGAFSGEATEHLSADEVHARAAIAVPEIGRGTVYAALAELTELGLLSAHGNPEPVRYETNTDSHQHFRCRLCLRVFDVQLPHPRTDQLSAEGFVIEALVVAAEGICAECVDYDQGLRSGAKRARNRPSGRLPDGLSAATVATPVGTLTIGATPRGVVRLVFDSHADVPELRETIRRRRGGQAARAHVVCAKAAVMSFFAGDGAGNCEIDWGGLQGVETLQAAQAIPPGSDTSYDLLDTPATAKQCGRVLGSNPVAILIPCHRVMRGRQIPDDYVAGTAIRQALREVERQA